MKNEIDFRLILDAYEKITLHGKAEQGKHTLDGITASTDFDGYTVFLEGHNTKLQLEFHNKYHLDYETSRDYENFMKKVEQISQGYSAPGRDK